jgi:hypothetical protein
VVFLVQIKPASLLKLFAMFDFFSQISPMKWTLNDEEEKLFYNTATSSSSPSTLLVKGLTYSSKVLR